MKHNKPVIIFDTDMDTDCDDVGAFAILLQAHSAGLVNLIGVVADSVCRYAAPCCEAIAEHYGVKLPIGAVHFDEHKDNIDRFGKYRELSEKNLSKSRAYNKILADKLQKTDKDYPSAVSVYRKLLSQAEDGSVTVVCVGMLTAVAEALGSSADELSPLNGIELFRRKVNKIITMGDPDKKEDFNWGMDAYAAERFFAACPVPVFISPCGKDIVTGEHLSTELPENHPLRLAYEVWTGKKNCGRSSWDLIASLYAVEPDTPLLFVTDLKSNSYDPDKKAMIYSELSPLRCKTVQLSCEPEALKEALNGYMLGKF